MPNPCPPHPVAPSGEEAPSPKAGAFWKTGLWKLLLGIAILGWMAVSGKLNFSVVFRTLVQSPMGVAILAIGYVQIAVTAWRWRLLLRGQQIVLAFRPAWALTMIGTLFNMVIPGSVSGDVIKGYYLTRTASSKCAAAASIVMDRVTGLLGLLLVAMLGLSIHPAAILQSSGARGLGLFTSGATVAGLAGIVIAVRAGKAVSESRFVPAAIGNIFDAISQYRKGSVVAFAVALSVLNQVLTCSMYYLALRAFGPVALTVTQFSLIVPLGLLATALPLSPGGVGVGQAAFFTLFRILAPESADLGANAFTMYQVIVLAISISGLYWYIGWDRPGGASQAAQ